jgi:methylated-DNA-[protein]-cysteine S-methyltransferase
VQTSGHFNASKAVMIETRSERLLLDRMVTPIGTAMLVTDAEGFLRAFDWSEFEPRLERLMRLQIDREVDLSDGPAPAAIRAAVEDYFAGDLGRLDAIPCRTGGTPFQREVWTALRTIPAGQTVSYAALAARIGRPRAVRAVGLANGANPTGVVVPCHRVIGADGSLTGYGGGLERKHWLLAHELQHAGGIVQTTLDFSAQR